MFGEDANGSPAVSGRVAVRDTRLGEVGLSYYGGYYNDFTVEGVQVDEKRWAAIAALDFGGDIGPVALRGEFAIASIDIQESLAELHGRRQWGGHVDMSLPVWRPRIPGYADAVVGAVLRIEAVDYNRGTFSTTGESIGDEVTAIVPGIAFRPTPGTVFRANYRYHWETDFQGNEPARLAGFQFGFATYF